MPDVEETKLAFSEETAAMLRRLQVSDRGCPSGRIASPEKPDTTILQHSWHRLVDYLVPPRRHRRSSECLKLNFNVEIRAVAKLVH